MLWLLPRTQLVLQDHGYGLQVWVVVLYPDGLCAQRSLSVRLQTVHKAALIIKTTPHYQIKLSYYWSFHLLAFIENNNDIWKIVLGRKFVSGTIWCSILICAQKLTDSQLNWEHRRKEQENDEKTQKTLMLVRKYAGLESGAIPEGGDSSDVFANCIG